ncbi:MAG: D-alanyl-D-alanine carboxypeptidase [Saprospiraceae bacterium]
MPYPKATEQFLPFTQYQLNREAILSDTLHRNVVDISYTEHPYQSLYPSETLYSTPLDTVLRRMMYQSDNFIAEQMLLVCAGAKFNLLKQDTMIRWALDSLFRELPQRPRWVDGSGLSRYNLTSPKDEVWVLQKLWQEQLHDRLLSLFPTAGAPETTLDWWQPVPERPWLYAKTGSMSGVQCMSGYLRTKSGKWLIFSFMHNNFVGSGKPWKGEMRRILEMVAAR